MSLSFATFLLASVYLFSNVKCMTLDAVETKCLKEFGYTKDIITYENDRLTKGVTEMNTFFSCVWKKKGLQRQDGSINYEKLYEMMVPEIKITLSDFGSNYVVIQSINECENVNGNDHGDTAIKVYNCLFDKTSKYVDEFKSKYEEYYE
ncbi:hypothetical protein RN001_013918 [Aquatica leii]|uniref:Uncharacterized protein n=1 Tax=Aquatica leii TaxID=1421715 RepID=A0AAN7SLT4_9COLE|nr:hypothetical protein RN001_013918 [Aquatica leii]